MKNFYLTILTLLTITQVDAARQTNPIDESLTGEVAPMAKLTAVRGMRGTPTASESGSYAGSHGVASTIMTQHTMYVLDETAKDISAEYSKLARAYTELLKITSATDTRLAQFVGVVEKILPNGIDRSSADEDSLVSLRTAFRQLMDMYKTLNKSYNGKTGETKVLESTVAELTVEQEALKATMAKMAPRPTEHMTTDMSPERVKATREVEAESSAVVAELRSENATLKAERDRLEAESARLAAKVAALEAAATKPAVKSSTGASKAGVKEPLLGSEDRSASGYTHLSDEPTHRKNKDDACPCVIM